MKEYLKAFRQNNAFASVSKDLVTLKEIRLREHHDPIPDKFIITPDEVEKQLSSTNKSKGMDPDAIPNWILKNSRTPSQNQYVIYLTALSEKVFSNNLEESECDLYT